MMSMTGDTAAAVLDDRMAPIRQRVAERAAQLRSQIAVREPVAVVRQREPVDWDKVLRDIRKFLRHFAVWPSEESVTAATLWIGQAHAKDPGTGLPAWQYSPRFLLTSSEYGSGKSWMARLMAKLAPNGEMLLKPTEPSFMDLVADRATVMITEADEQFRSPGRSRGIVAAVNAGYEPDHAHTRKQGGKVIRTPLFGPVLLDGLDTLLSASRPDLRTMVSRCIIVRVRRAPDGYRPPRFDREARLIAERRCQRTAEWMAQAVRDDIGDYVPDLPEGVGNRPAALWEPLCAVADWAGGEWPELARTACVQLESASGLPDEDDAEGAELDAILAGWED